MGRPSQYYDVRNRKWVFRGASGGEDFTITEGGVIKATGGLKTGTSTTISQINRTVATSAAIAGVGTNAVAVGTLSVTGVAVGDTIICTPKATFAAGLMLGQPRVATTNTINVYVSNPGIAANGSLPATGWDVLWLKS